MPPIGFKSLSIPEETYKAVVLARAKFVFSGTSSLPPRLRRLVKGQVTNAKVIELALAALNEVIK
jgi:hypothetical protein